MNSEWLDLHALVDDQLSPEERARVQQGLKTSETAQIEFLAVRRIKTLVQEKCVQMHCEEVWCMCCKRLDEIDRTKRVEGFVGRYAWAICSVFICLIFGAAWLNRLNGAGLNASDVAKAASTLAPISAPRSQNPNVKRQWLQQNLDREMPVQPDMISVVGGAAGYLDDGRKISRADLQDREVVLRLYVVQAADHLEGGAQVDGHTHYLAARINDSNCITFSRNGNAYVLVGDRPVDALCQVADQLYGSR